MFESSRCFDQIVAVKATPGTPNNHQQSAITSVIARQRQRHHNQQHPQQQHLPRTPKDTTRTLPLPFVYTDRHAQLQARVNPAHPTYSGAVQIRTKVITEKKRPKAGFPIFRSCHLPSLSEPIQSRCTSCPVLRTAVPTTTTKYRYETP